MDWKVFEPVSNMRRLFPLRHCFKSSTYVLYRHLCYVSYPWCHYYYFNSV